MEKAEETQFLKCISSTVHFHMAAGYNIYIFSG